MGKWREEGRDGDKPSRALKEVARKCEAFGIETEMEEPDGDEPSQLWVEFPEWPRLPDGSIEFILWIDDGPHAQFALDAPFERYRRFRENYTGVWSGTLGIVECEIVPCDEPPGTSRYGDERHDAIEGVLKTLGLSPEDAEDVFDPELRLRLEAEDGAVASVGPSSDAFAVWQMDVDSDLPSGRELEVQRALTVRVEGIEMPDEARAAEVIERFGNAALFEIDRAFGVGLRPSRHAGWRHDPGDPTGAVPDRLMSEYDREPMTLYWYARSAADMPLLAFLAYYQVLEFYFPVHSRTKALGTLRAALAGLNFESMRDADLVKVLETIRVNSKGGFGREGEQLKATLKQCVSPEALHSFFEQDVGRMHFFGSEACTVVSPTTVTLGGAPRDVRGEVARRVYEIRNRIVHTKGGSDDLDPLLPFDPETALLSYDIALVRFLARAVLRANARPLGGGRAHGRSEEDER
jgi:hypothetical protein